MPRLLLLAIALFTLFSCSTRSGKPRILVFSKTAGFRHSSIPDGKAAIMKLGAENGFLVDTTEDPSYFNEDSLKNYSAVVFLHSTGDLLNNYEEADFERYIQAGGGYVGIHAASDAEYDWGWYGRLVGGYFESHPAQQDAVLNVVDNTHGSTKHLPAQWKRKDEWYNFKKLNPDVKVLIKIDEKSYQGGKNGDNHPMAWYHEFDGGRAWYTELGHTEESFKEDNYLKHILGGIQYAIGENKNLDYDKATTLRVPENDRFTKVMLSQGEFYEPTEMAVLPNLDVLIAQRRGEVMLYKNSTHTVKQVGFLDVYFKTLKANANAEEGLLGLQADPDFDKNHYVYLFYSPSDTSVNRLSRFTFVNDTLDRKTEKIILQFYSQREICCHTGGSITFGNDHELFLSTGDNSTPFDSPTPFANHGFGPMDDREGFEQYDARRSSGNTNDLRGKILRIKINPDGSYSVPDGNLFPKGTDKTRPEIYVMGNRNPYRIAFDKKRNYLYWGEVGPDAGADSLDTRGPRGYDELNQAKKAGFFGWPFFVGNNYPYAQYNYTTGAIGAKYDPAHPVNTSRNNTGLTDLPPVSPAFIWYPYAASPDFPQMGTGGRNAMAGPTYYVDQYPKETRYPDYYNGKVFIYEWMRNFIKVVTLDEKGDFYKMEPFLSGTKLNAVIDMEMAPNGRIYMLEYGSGWFSKNPDAGLSYIEYNGGNRLPVVGELKVDKLSGALPYKITATVEARDPEKKALSYTWDLGNGEKKTTTEPKLEYTYTKAGDFSISVEVTDDAQGKVKSNAVAVYSGNETPDVKVAVEGNQTFYFPGVPVKYKVTVSDKDDAAAGQDLSTLVVNADYQEGTDMAASGQGHKILSTVMLGKNTMMALDCKNCHQVDTKSIGPAFTDVAKKYEKQAGAMDYLSAKIIRGGGGVWGETPMAAHPNLKQDDAKLIVTWIMSLASAEARKPYPANGSLDPTLGKPAKDNGVLTITATYTDKGGNGIKPMTGTGFEALRSASISLNGATDINGFNGVDYGGKHLLVLPKTQGWFSIANIDLTSVKSVFLLSGWQQAPVYGFDFEIRLDAPDGQLLGKGSLAGGLPTKGGMGGAPVLIATTPVTDGKLHKVYVVTKPKDPKEPNMCALTGLQFQAK